MNGPEGGRTESPVAKYPSKDRFGFCPDEPRGVVDNPSGPPIESANNSLQHTAAFK